jgi:hypothetical protein
LGEEGICFYEERQRAAARHLKVRRRKVLVASPGPESVAIARLWRTVLASLDLFSSLNMLRRLLLPLHVPSRSIPSCDLDNPTSHPHSPSPSRSTTTSHKNALLVIFFSDSLSVDLVELFRSIILGGRGGGSAGEVDVDVVARLPTAAPSPAPLPIP